MLHAHLEVAGSWKAMNRVSHYLKTVLYFLLFKRLIKGLNRCPRIFTFLLRKMAICWGFIRSSWKTVLGASFFHSLLSRSVFPSLPSDAVNYLSSIVLQHLLEIASILAATDVTSLLRKMSGAIVLWSGKFVTRLIPLAWDPGKLVLQRWAFFSIPVFPELWENQAMRPEGRSQGAWGAVKGGRALLPAAVPGMCFLPDEVFVEEEGDVTRNAWQPKWGTVQEKDPWWTRSAWSWCKSRTGQCAGTKYVFFVR